jgi:hypothetical protein
MRKYQIFRVAVIFTTMLVLVACYQRQACADYVTFGQGFGSKWGTPQHGTASDVITWSFMPDGTTLHASHPLLGEVTGTSNLSDLRGRFGPGVFEQVIQNAFNTWSEASQGRVTFLQVPDNGAPGGGNSVNNNNPGSWAIDIRIGAFTASPGSGFSFVGAVGFGPPGDDTFPFFQDGLAGDIIFNLSQHFFVAPGNEGDIFYDGNGPYINDLEGLMLHELGHAAIGLGHPNSGIGEVMYVNDFPNCCNFINRQPSPDDIAGAREVYGGLEAEIMNSWPYHAAFSGAGTPPWNRLDTGKVLLQESGQPQLLSYDNLINTAQGINGIVFDIQNLPETGNLSINDFTFQISPGGAFNAEANPPISWLAAPAPSSISVFQGDPARVLIEWPNGSITNRWLRVTIMATENTGLAEPTTYYLGHMLGETTGPADGTFTVSFADITAIRSSVGQAVPASNQTDTDKNGTVSFADISAMRGNVGAQLTQISLP